jgi:hypothetical protein
LSTKFLELSVGSWQQDPLGDLWIFKQLESCDASIAFKCKITTFWRWDNHEALKGTKTPSHNILCQIDKLATLCLCDSANSVSLICLLVDKAGILWVHQEVCNRYGDVPVHRVRL